MGTELNMSSTDYSIVLLVFFISYVLFEAPSNMILTRVRPSIYMPASSLASSHIFPTHWLNDPRH